MPILHDFSQLLCQEFSCKHKNAAKESWQQDRRKLMDKLDQNHKERVSKKTLYGHKITSHARGLASPPGLVSLQRWIHAHNYDFLEIPWKLSPANSGSSWQGNGAGRAEFPGGREEHSRSDTHHRAHPKHEGEAETQHDQLHDRNHKDSERTVPSDRQLHLSIGNRR